MNQTEEKRSKLSLGIALIMLGSMFVFVRPRSGSVAGIHSLQNEPVIIEGFEKQTAEEVVTPKRIIIPSLSVDLSVEPAEIVNGYWEVFEDKAAWGIGSGEPGKVGNQVIFAHSREGLFLPLLDSFEGMVVYVMSEKDWFSYEVVEIKEVIPNQTEVIKPTEDETLTMYTCSGDADAKRLVVVAKRVMI